MSSVQKGRGVKKKQQTCGPRGGGVNIPKILGMLYTWMSPYQAFRNGLLKAFHAGFVWAEEARARFQWFLRKTGRIIAKIIEKRGPVP